MTSGTRRRVWAWTRPVVGVAILAVLVRRIGTRPFVNAVQLVDARSLVAVGVITVLTTLCSAWRWQLVSRGLGLDLPLRTAVVAYYRSQLLNSTLPGGVLGDVHRGVLQGRAVGDTGLALRAVAWERVAGQVVQVLVAVSLLVVLPSPVRPPAPSVATVGAVGAVVAVALVVAVRVVMRTGDVASRRRRILRTAVDDLRGGLIARRCWPGVVVASLLAVAGHTATFLVAARVAGSTASATQLLPLALLVLVAMGLPTNVAGWGPREGAAAWAFGAAGLGAAQGVTTGAVYGVLVLTACLPGLAVLVADRLPRPAPPARAVRGPVGSVVRPPESIALERVGRG